MGGLCDLGIAALGDALWYSDVIADAWQWCINIWRYESPEKNLFLVDGKTAWFYVPQDHTVTRVPAKESLDWRTPLALLAGETKISRICERVEFSTVEKSESADHAMLYCVPRGAAAKKPAAGSGLEPKTAGRRDAVFLEIARDTGELMRVVVRERGGLEIEYRFKNWQMNLPIPDSFFHFAVPAGVAIVDGEGLSGSTGAKP